MVCLHSYAFSSLIIFLIIIRSVEICVAWHSANISIQPDFGFSFSQIFNFYSVGFLELWKNSNYTNGLCLGKLKLYLGQGESEISAAACKNCKYTSLLASDKLYPSFRAE